MQDKCVLRLIVAAVAVALIPTLPYGYYSAMRWVVSAACAWVALSAHRADREDWTWCWAVIAGIYNPIFPVHANRAIWSSINVATIAVTVWYGLRASQLNRGTNNERET